MPTPPAAGEAFSTEPSRTPRTNTHIQVPERHQRIHLRLPPPPLDGDGGGGGVAATARGARVLDGGGGGGVAAIPPPTDPSLTVWLKARGRSGAAARKDLVDFDCSKESLSHARGLNVRSQGDAAGT